LQSIRAVVKDLDTTTRTLMAHFNAVHAGRQDASVICDQADAYFVPIRQHLQALATLIPPQQYYRYQDHFSRTLQSICFCCAWLVYLRHGRLATPQDIEGMTTGASVLVRWLMQVAVNQQGVFAIPIEDYLHGLISMSNELARLAVTSVIAGDYQRPMAISAFVEELYGGFQLLNLKNDALRKRFDSIKYDIKKIEEVVYAVSLRGLASKSTQ
jgi:hypothetical protein